MYFFLITSALTLLLRALFHSLLLNGSLDIGSLYEGSDEITIEFKLDLFDISQTRFSRIYVNRRTSKLECAN